MARRGGARNVPLWTAIAATLVAGVLAVVHVRRGGLPGLAALEGLSIDMRFRLRGPRDPATDRIVIVGIDDATRAKAPEIVQTRRGYARLLDAISACKPKLVAIDFFFSAPEELLPEELVARVRTTTTGMDTMMKSMPADMTSSDPQAADTMSKVMPMMHEMHDVLAAVADELRGDEVLAQAIARSHAIVLGAYVRDGPPVRGVTEPEGLKLARLGQAADTGGGDPLLRPITGSDVVFSLPMFARGAVGAGTVNDLRDEDGVRRRMPLVVEYGGRHYMTLGLAVALAELGRPRDTRYVAGAPTVTVAGTELGLTRAASLPLDMLGRGRIPRVSAADLLDGKSCERVAGKLAFVGFTYAAFDKIATPFDQRADGVELHATVAENVLGGRILRNTGWLATVGSTLVLCLIVCVAQLRRVRRRAWMPPLIALGAIVGYVVIGVLVFARGTVIELAAPATLAGLTLIAATIGGLATEGREKAHLRMVFSQYVSRPVVDRILADPGQARLGGERKELTVLFSDIRGFSQVAEGMAPEALAAFLGEYLTPMTDLVLASGGTLDKYIGDAVMAIWGAPVDMPDHAARACEVALKMQEALAEMNRAWQRAGKPPIAIGIGLNTGAMAVGNMGSAARFEYTVLGDQVNLGARLEALTKELGVGILVGEATARAAGDGFVFREIDVVRVKGRAMAAPVFELCGRAGHRVEPAFGEALALYRRREFAAARAAFARIEHDPAAQVMAERCEVLAASPPPPDWDGVYEQRSK
ncbi:MAG TPA: adenylate/guanylate cyclase domain-containing protein [Kofleriaceae bacterium]|nr:adenylate/guanylate cyclase domain-containing protein [Kofleriaceae bacterium]